MDFEKALDALGVGKTIECNGVQVRMIASDETELEQCVQIMRRTATSFSWSDLERVTGAIQDQLCRAVQAPPWMRLTKTVTGPGIKVYRGDTYLAFAPTKHDAKLFIESEIRLHGGRWQDFKRVRTKPIRGAANGPTPDDFSDFRNTVTGKMQGRGN